MGGAQRMLLSAIDIGWAVLASGVGPTQHLDPGCCVTAQPGVKLGQQVSSQSWAQELATRLVDALKACDAGRTAGVTALSAAEFETFAGCYRSGVQAGLALNPAAAKIEGRKGRTKQSCAFNLQQRLEQDETEVLYLMHNLAVSFTKNLSERAIQMQEPKQRVSGCFRTFCGAPNFSPIRSYIDSASKQGIGMLHALQAAFAGMPL